MKQLQNRVTLVNAVNSLNDSRKKTNVNYCKSEFTLVFGLKCLSLLQ